MKIAFIDTLGLAYDGSTLDKKGLGGSESACIHMAHELSLLGHSVTVYNDCHNDDCTPGIYSDVTYRPLSYIDEHFEADVAIALRSVAPFVPTAIAQQQETPFKTFTDKLPSFEAVQKSSCHKILWMHDTFCDGDNLIEFLLNSDMLDEVYTLSDWHTSYITNCNHGLARDPSVLKSKIWQTRNGANVWPEERVILDDKELDGPPKYVYNASATKGLVPLIEHIWPAIRAEFPDAELTVIGGYYNFRNDSPPDEQQLKVMELIDSKPEGVTFTGVIKQSEIGKILRKSWFMLYPSAFPETYGISTLEAILHGCPPITCNRGALEEVAIDAASYKINYAVEKDYATAAWLDEEDQRQRFINLTLAATKDKYRYQQKFFACDQVRGVASWSTVAAEWNFHLNQVTGRYDLHAWQTSHVVRIKRDVQRVFNRRFQDPRTIDMKTYEETSGMDSIGVVVCAYNAEAFIQKCLKSIYNQVYKNYTVYIIDDASRDQTSFIAQIFIDNLPWPHRHKFKLRTNKTNVGALCNQVSTFRQYKHDNWLIIDGDDALVSDPWIFCKYAEYLENNEMVYGSVKSMVDNLDLIAQPYPDVIKKNNRFTEYRFPWIMPYTHLRGYRSSLLDKIDLSMLKHNGEFYRAAGDLALQYECLHNARRIKHNTEVVYLYNDVYSGNDYKVNKDEQDRNKAEIVKRARDKWQNNVY